MRHKKNFDNDPVTDFMRLMREELKSEPGLHLRVERIPQGLMADHLVRYIPVNQIELEQGIESQIKRWFHGGCYNLTLADIELEPLENIRSLWIDIAGDMRSGFEKRKTRTEKKLAGAIIEHRLEEDKNTTKQTKNLLDICQTMTNFFVESNLISSKLLTEMLLKKDRRDKEQQKQKAIWEFFAIIEIMKKKRQNEIAEKNKKQYEELDQILKNMGGSH